MITDWDAAYNNRAAVAGVEDIIASWTRKAAAFRAAARGRTDIPCGDTDRECYDLFEPEGTPAGLVVFIHGGYWLYFDKSYWSHLAAGPLAHGYAVAVVQYPLAPEARIPQMTRAVGRAITHAAGEIAGPIRIAGHSAGGHLAARMITDTTPLPDGVRARICHCVPVSGLFDLRPMMRLSMNADWRLDQSSAMAESPAFLMPDPRVSVDTWVGGAELPEFLRHSELLANIWTGCGATISLTRADGCHHFDVIDGLETPTHPLTVSLCKPL